MQITEQNKQEAEKVLWNYGKYLGIQMEYKEATNCAIQDRQSVLEAMQMVVFANDTMTEIYIKQKTESLTEQIEFLKSKL